MKGQATIVLASFLTFAGAARAASDSTEVGFAPETETAAAPMAGGTTFGAPGQWVLTMGLGTGQHLLYNKQGSAWQLQLQPALDYFLTPRFSVGGLLGYRHATGGTGTGVNASGTDALTIGARGGANFAVNPLFSVWPTAGLLLDWISVNHASTTNTYLALSVPVLFHPAAHFFAALGPSFDVNLSGPGQNRLGVSSMLGGWF